MYNIQINPLDFDIFSYQCCIYCDYGAVEFETNDVKFIP